MRVLKLIISLFFVLVLSCNSRSNELSVLSYTIDDSGKKKHYTITYKGFTNQLGNPFSTEDLKGKVCIANFFFTRCPSICPPMRTELISLAETFSEDKNVMLISHSIEPKHDSVSVLKAYAEATRIPHEQWQFLTAPEDKIKAQSKQYMTNFRPNDDGTDFYHSSFVALIDQQQKIRGFYNVLINTEVKRLTIDIKTLLE